MAVEKALPLPNLVSGVVVQVGAQTGFDVDDVAVRTDDGNFALFQAKAGMSLGKTEKSDLAKALEQAVAQYLIGPLPVDGGSNRKVDPLRDALVMCTDSAAPATVRVDLKTALERTASQPPGTSLGHELTAKQDAALKILLNHVRRIWTKSQHTSPGDEQIRTFLRVLHVVTINAQDGGPDHATSVAALSTVLQSYSDATAAWKVLVDEGQAASEAREWKDRAAIGRALSLKGISLSPPSEFTKDITRLRAVSTTNLEAMAEDAELPVSGGFHIARTVSDRLVTDAGDTNVLILGDAGVGKSAVAQEFATVRSKVQDVVVLRASDIAGQNKVPLTAKLTTILKAWDGPDSLLMIDGFDALREAEDRRYLNDTVAELRGSRWQVVASARTFDARNSPELRKSFAGTPMLNNLAQEDTHLRGVRHIRVGDLTEAELDTVTSTSLGPILAGSEPALRALLRNPFNLRLAAELAENLSADRQNELLAIRTRVGLLDMYWERRVRHDDSTAREALLTRLCSAMVSRRSLAVVEREPVVSAVDSSAMTALLSENVLSGQRKAIPGAQRVLSFSHNILFDYAVVLYVLFDPMDSTSLLTTLDADPSLPLVVRPSFDMLGDLLWEHSREEDFWPLCRTVAGSEHVLASLTFAARLLSLIREADDLAPLAPTPGRADRPDGSLPDQDVARQLTGAVRNPIVLPDATQAVAPLATFARTLAKNSAASFNDAALAVDLLQGLQIRNPVTPADPGSSDRADAVAALLDGCRTDPERMEPLAGAAARHLKHVVGVSDTVRSAVGRLLNDDRALSQWGGTILPWIAESVAPTVAHDIDLARRMAESIVTFEETRDERVPLGGSVLVPLNYSRRDQAGQGVYVLNESFGEICSANLPFAAGIFCDLAEDPNMSVAANGWPLSVVGADGWLDNDFSSQTLHHLDGTAARALSAALIRANSTDTDAVIAILVRRLHNTAAWAALLTTDHDALSLGRVLLPAFGSGALLVHPDTHSPAAALLAAVAGREPTLAGQLEDAVVNAIALADAHHLPSYITSALIGCLNTDAISTPILQARFRAPAQDGPPNDDPPATTEIPAREWSQFDELPSQGIQLDEAFETVGRALHAELQLANNRGDTRPEVERHLPELFETADAVFATSDDLPLILQRLIVDAADALACDKRIQPGMPVADRVLDVLLTAVDHPHAGTILGSNSSIPGVRDTAVRGLTNLLTRREWKTSDARPQIVERVSAALRDNNPLVRMQAAHVAADVVANSGSTDTPRAVGDLILAEENTTVRIGLLAQLRKVAIGAEETVDRILERLLSASPVEPNTNLGRNTIGLLTYLALTSRTPYASRVLEEWCRDAPAHASEVKAFAQHARDHLGPNGGDERAEAYRLLSAAARSARDRWTRDPEEHRSPELPKERLAELQGAVKVAHAIAQEVYFTDGGAYAYKQKGGPAPGPEHVAFADLAYPLLATCARLHAPQSIHESVQTMIFLAPLDEKRALQAIAEAVPARGLYASDHVVGGDLIPYLERLLAEERPLVLHDTAGVAAFRHLLATFASAGNTEALTLAYTFAEVFR